MLSRRPVALLAALVGVQAGALESSCASSSMLQIGRDRARVAEISNNLEGTNLTEDVQGDSPPCARRGPKPKLCLAWGDPHLVGFDGAWRDNSLVIMRSSIIRAVKTHDIDITLYCCNAVGSLEMVTVKGALTDNHMLMFQSEGYKKGVRVTWNHKQHIVRHVGETWQVPVRRGTVRCALVRGIRPEPEEYRVTHYKQLLQEKLKLGHQHVCTLPGGLMLYVANPYELSVVIKMNKRGPEQEGMCGNFDGNAANDGLQHIAKRMGGLGGVILNTCKSGRLPYPPRVSLLNTSDTAQKDRLTSYCDDTEEGRKFKSEALQACSIVKEELFHKSCVEDACATGSLSVAGDEIAEEFMASEAAHHVSA